MRRFFNGCSKLAKTNYYFYVRISSIKVFCLLMTSIGKATGTNCQYLLVHCWKQSQLSKSVSLKFISLSFSFLVVKMDWKLGRASTTENCNENDNDAIFLFKMAVLSAIKIIRKKKPADKESMFDYLTKSLASNIEM